METPGVGTWGPVAWEYGDIRTPCLGIWEMETPCVGTGGHQDPLCVDVGTGGCWDPQYGDIGDIRTPCLGIWGHWDPCMGT